MNWLERLAELIQNATLCTEEHAILAAHDICDELDIDPWDEVSI